MHDSVLTLARQFVDKLRPIVVQRIKVAGMGRGGATSAVNNIKLTVSERDVLLSS
jgi:hypothetical protein